MARKSKTAVIFRRGPSKWVQLIRRDTGSDTFEPGQWFHGRIYEKRGDLSPDGSLLVYFAQKISARTLKDKEYTYAWTAISKPPYLTALALWPKADCWDGGGLFLSPRGEDDPIFSERLKRDGWSLKQAWQVEFRGHPNWYRTTQPEVREKWNRNRNYVLQMTRSISRLDYSEEYTVTDRRRSHVHSIARASWVDWDQNGRLTFARDGKIFTGKQNNDGCWTEAELANFNSSRPEPLPSPAWAKKW
jgi:hypothetical protein